LSTCKVTVTSHARCVIIELEQSHCTMHISYQHRRSRSSGSVLRLFSSGAPILIY